MAWQWNEMIAWNESEKFNVWSDSSDEIFDGREDVIDAATFYYAVLCNVIRLIINNIVFVYIPPRDLLPAKMTSSLM